MKLIDILVEELPRRGGWPKRANCITQDGDLRVEPAFCHPSIAKCDEDGFWFLDSSRTGGFEVDTLASDYTTAIITREQYESALAAKNDGWIEWAGGECPVEEGALVDVKYRDGDEFPDALGVPALSGNGTGSAFWERDDYNNDIIAYRLHKPQEVAQDEADDEADLNECIGQDAAQFWSGEEQPPVGVECECSWCGDEWQPCKILFASNQIVVVKLKESGMEDAYNIGDVTFRPIHSEADRKRDAAKNAIAELCRSSASNGHSADLIYDAIAAGKIPGVKLED